MSDVAEHFRVGLSRMLRTALTERDAHATRTLRCIMAVVDNAGALSPEEQASYLAASMTEAPRRRLSEPELAAILEAEIADRRKTATAYERRGNTDQAALLRAEIALIEQMELLLKRAAHSS